MTFSESVSSVFEKYAKGAGRASRSEYWWWYLFTFLVGLVVGLIEVELGTGSILTGIVNLALLCPGICVAIRRCHDSGHSGWWGICPSDNLVMMFLPSGPNENGYGMPEE